MIAPRIAFQTCSCCGEAMGISNFLPTKNKFYANKFLPICNHCLAAMIKIDEKQEPHTWRQVDKICQYIDIPFIPARWQEMYEKQGREAIVSYCRIFQETDYRTINWHEQEVIYEQLREDGQLSNAVIPRYSETQLEGMRAKWGANYDDEELSYLEELYNGVVATQSINGALQMD